MTRRLQIIWLVSGLLIGPGCGPGLTPPSASTSAPGAHSGSIDAGTTQHGGAGAGGASMSVPETSGASGMPSAHDAGSRDVDAGSEDAGEP